MPGFLYHVGVAAMCGHAGQISAVSASPRVRLSGQVAVTIGDTFPIAGCTLNVSGAPHPCVRVQWLVPSSRVRIGGQPAILQTSTGMTLAADMAPQGAPVVLGGQARVRGV